MIRAFFILSLLAVTPIAPLFALAYQNGQKDDVIKIAYCGGGFTQIILDKNTPESPPNDLPKQCNIACHMASQRPKKTKS
ncbi:hypothetical protein LPB140_02690 [Sphingorhabdus lutea]|uniref:Uncharacterized protein n=1 Tax=Sphingorhabdus lutea TaxID=1913578 RepID=A0A1L3J9U1_9SPHN|nr:hypothetical protein [Sphingorhabdus lutea]APG61912.1 hypothetical protein LPB140_02690 [Sphingorhabdus lutea]